MVAPAVVAQAPGRPVDAAMQRRLRRLRATALNIDDLASAARQRLPRGIWEFLDGGTEDQHATVENVQALLRLRLRPAVLRDVARRSLATTFLGQPVQLPFGFAPTGASGLAWFKGEVAIARAAWQAGIPFSLATGSMTSVEQIAQESPGTNWFQLYFWAERQHTWDLVERVEKAGFDALILTVDTAVSAKREYNVRNGFALPFRVTHRNALDVACHPAWAAGVLGRYLMAGGMPRYENYPPALRVPITGAAPTGVGLANDALTWGDVRELRRRWPRKLIVKGILRADDAMRAVEAGADAVVVSNHGGRNLDASISPIDALPDVVDAVRGTAEVAFDGGVRRGSDIFKALALGARMVLVGRAGLYGVAAAGEAGVTHAISILRDELDRTMAMCGCRSISEITPDFVAAQTRTGR